MSSVRPRRPPGRLPAAGGTAPHGDEVSPAATYDALVARTAARLGAAGRPMSRAALEALAHEVVREAACFALRWAEGGGAPGPRCPAAPPPEVCL